MCDISVCDGTGRIWKSGSVAALEYDRKELLRLQLLFNRSHVPGSWETGKHSKIGRVGNLRQSHMGRVLSINSKNKTFECDEGNTSNKKYERNGDSCAVKTYSWTDGKIKSFCYIDYGTEKETEPDQSTVKPVTKPDTPVKTLGNVGKGQKWLNTNYGSTLEKYMKEILDVDDSFGKKSRAAAVCVWKDLCNRKYKTKLDPSNSNFLSSCKKAAKKVVIKREHPARSYTW